MKTIINRPPFNRFNGKAPLNIDTERRGSVLLMVIGLLSLLLLAGIAFYTFASQENSSAEYYSESASNSSSIELSADQLFDFSMEQLILGPDESLTMSALRGGRTPATATSIEIPGRHSLLAGVIGNDTAAYNGLGIPLSTDMTGANTGTIGAPFVDFDQNGTLDPGDDQSLLNRVNYSAATNNGALPALPSGFALDTGYTSPDINSPYLAYIGNGLNYQLGGNSIDQPVVIPTFHRPQYLRGGPGDLTGTGNGPRLFRPHPENKCPGGTFRYSNAFPFSANPDGTTIKQGVWDPTVSSAYNWDVDNDGDELGIREGIWIDLDFPVQDLADGRSFVPLFSFTVLDADGLINLNASGNSLAWVPPTGGNPNSAPIAYPGTSNYIHRSNLGLSRTEINPLWGLLADSSLNPTSNPIYFKSASDRDNALTQMRVFWNLPIGTTPSRVDTANMDFLSILLGRVDFTPAAGPSPGTYASGTSTFAASRFIPGRRGESGLLSSAIATVGGASTSLIPGSIPVPGGFGDDDNDNNPTSYMIQPIDYLGMGSTYQSGANNALTQLLLPPSSNPNSPCRWPAYNGYANLGGTSVGYGIADGGSLFANPVAQMIDEEDESIVDTSAQTAATGSNDAMFGPAEMFGLHGSNFDFDATQSTSRLRSLAQFNFAESKIAEFTRGQYTVMSMDRLQFGLGFNASRTGEFSADIDNDTHMEFPPAVFPYDGTTYAGLDPREPIRLPLRRYLTVENGENSLSSGGGFRMNMNQLIWTNPNSGQIESRVLTDHPVDPGATDVAATYASANPAYPPSDAPSQEWWARYDRQLLARDMYVLLYLLGSSDGTYSYTTDQIKEMAQFAVNYVDAMDADENITKFEYDTNPLNGWQLGDDPYRTADDTAAERAVAYGVETQSLTLSEGLVIHTPELMSDQAGATTFNDTIERWYTALELRNVSAFDVDLSAKAWRIRIIDQALDQTPPLAPTMPSPERYLTFKSGSIGHGNNYLIGSRTGSDQDKDNNARPSNFRVNMNHESETAGSYSYEPIVPAVISSTIVPVPSATVATDAIADPGTWFDLDLVHASGAGKFDLYNDSSSVTVTPPGDLVNSGAAGTNVRFAIERRLHLTRTSLASTTDNPWIEVDRMDVPVKEFNITNGMTGADLKSMVLPNLISRERGQPFSRASEGSNTPAAPNLHLPNSFGQVSNSKTTSAFVRWQPHFNRPYTSAMDLLTLPLFGPTNFTLRFGEGVAWDGAPNFAQERFLRTVNNVDGTQNRWYRLLGLIGVPTRSQMNVSQAPYALRTPGVINLNTIRHRAVLASLIDDVSTQFANSATNASTPNTLLGHLNPFYNTTTPQTMLLDNNVDQTDGVQRDWWAEFIAAREQRDPRTNLFLPGMAHSRPFRSLNYADAGALSIESTLLRSLYKDDPNFTPTIVNRRGLFEASYSLNTATDGVDLHTRHRLLRKISNNSTTRSHVFSVWVSVGLFQATRVGNDVQIGGPLNGTGEPTYRGYFVVDRSLPEQALDTNTGKFDFQQFIKYRKTIR